MILRGTREAWEPTINSFPEIDVDQLARDLRLEERGKAAAGVQLPSGVLEDSVEFEVRAGLEKRLRTEQSSYHSALNTLDARLQAAAFDAQACVLIESSCTRGLGDFKASTEALKIPLSTAETSVARMQKQFDRFVHENMLEHTDPHIVSRTTQGWALAIIAVLFLGESVLNAFFFAEGSSAGLLGGFLEAAVLAAVNLVLAGLLGYVAIRNTNHVSPWYYFLLGWLFVAVLLAAIPALNLLIAHYRQAFMAANGEEVVFPVVLEGMRADPLSLGDARSWLLAALGLVANGLASWKFHSLSDRYPGFGQIARRLATAYDNLQEERTHQLGLLEARRNTALRSLEEILKDANQKHREFELAIRSRVRLQRDFERFVQQINTVFHLLCATYRQHAGREVSHSALIGDPVAPLPNEPEFDRAAYERAIQTASEAIAAIGRDYDVAVKSVTAGANREAPSVAAE